MKSFVLRLDFFQLSVRRCRQVSLLTKRLDFICLSNSWSTFEAISASWRFIVLLLLVVNISGASFCTVLIFVLGINCRLSSLLWPLFSDLHHRNGCILLTSDLTQSFFPPTFNSWTCVCAVVVSLVQHKHVVVSLHGTLFLCKSSKTAAAACCVLLRKLHSDTQPDLVVVIADWSADRIRRRSITR